MNHAPLENNISKLLKDNFFLNNKDLEVECKKEQLEKQKQIL